VRQTGPFDAAGSWQLKEVLADPGDGSGTFNPVQSERILLILGNGTFFSNQNLCAGPLDYSKSTQGTVDIENKFIIPDNCSLGEDQPFQINYSVIGDELILSYLCIEPCAEKYARVTDSKAD